MSVITGQGVTAYPLPDEELSPTSKNAVSNEAVCDGLDELKNTLNHKADVIYDTASGDIASFPDGADGMPVKDLTVGIEPVQDLHGYENPWPGGGGKNKVNQDSAVDGADYFDVDGSIISAAGRYVCPNVDLPNGTYTISWGNTSSGNFVRLNVLDSSGNFIRRQLTSTSQPQTFTLSGTDAKVQIVFNGITKLQLESGTTASAYAPYSNICPISGWTGANVTRTGKNVINQEGTNTNNGYAHKSYIDPSGNVRGADGSWDVLEYVPVKPNTTYTISGFTATVNNGYLEYNASKQSVANGVALVAPYTFTTGQDTYYVRFNRQYSTDTQVQLELGSTATAYEQYRGETIPISWQSSAGTVYGGTLDVTSGVLTVDKGFTTIGSGTWTYNVYFSSNLIQNIVKKPASNNDTANAICEAYEIKARNSMADKKFCVQNDGMLLFRDSAYDSVSAFTTAMGSTKVIFELATPQTYQLTTEEVTTLLGQNNIWADCGPSTVEYPCDTKLYIQKINTPTDDDMIADANIASGKYFIINNNLYLSTAAILAGDPIKPGTNCTLTNLAAALNALNS